MCQYLSDVTTHNIVIRVKHTEESFRPCACGVGLKKNKDTKINVAIQTRRARSWYEYLYLLLPYITPHLVVGRRARLLICVAWGLAAAFSVPMLILNKEMMVNKVTQCWIPLPHPWHWRVSTLTGAPDRCL